MEYVTLNNGVEMPSEGFGVFTIEDLDVCEQAVLDALDAGYRLIDTASAYMNEEAVGAAIRKSNVPREELFITTKLWVQDAGYEAAKQAFETSLEKLGLEYIDLYLIHQPFNDYYGSWRAMEKLYEEGKIRAIGLNNFDNAPLVDLIMNSKIVPAVLQIEMHPFFQQQAAIDVMKAYDIQPQAWSPLAKTSEEVLNNSILSDIAKVHQKTVPQIMLRWHIQRGISVIPKSTHRNRIEENLDVWDFELTEEEMNKIKTLDQGKSLYIDRQTVETVEMFNNWKIHD
ncbi:aldo/keto reductase [Staphylococcus gallinarum]|uniref:aldo/keto reductase n=1 Tax=Staphylococcus gallinarum TaxID=1293 RepID=UPI000D1FAB14|nr:aldo/keto reductase [Staphylococcus gallinarum]PTL12694.1 2,5-diketo-D-gluconic acid reductase [Staphylococcus gallinarum]RIO77475.1 aldo/keto reductase [Staphylococcus gallinarum]